MQLSIIIPNYNYERYVGQAIESALALEHSDKEVIVVDDGSTDGSRTIIEEYADKKVVLPVFKKNGGLSDAVNAGYSQAGGDLIYILDADDLVLPTMMRELLTVFRPGVSKVQFYLEIVNDRSELIWSAKPPIPPPAQIRSNVLRSGIYPTPPTSGNVYSADFLRRVMPIAPTEIWADAALNLLAPLYGDVVAIPKVLARYRMHGGNLQSAVNFDVGLCRKHIRQTELRDELLQRFCRQMRIEIQPNTRDRDQIALNRRLVSIKLEPALHPIKSDSVLSVLAKALIATALTTWMKPSQRLVLVAWSLAFSLVPRKLGLELAKLRYVPSYRPRLLVEAMRLFGPTRGVSTGKAAR
jgi:glycosyltransferase involved in cell wall biosynthesis